MWNMVAAWVWGGVAAWDCVELAAWIQGVAVNGHFHWAPGTPNSVACPFFPTSSSPLDYW